MKHDVIITTDSKIILNRMMIVKFDRFLTNEDYKKRAEQIKKEFNTGFVLLQPMEKALVITETGEIKCID